MEQIVGTNDFYINLGLYILRIASIKDENVFSRCKKRLILSIFKPLQTSLWPFFVYMKGWSGKESVLGILPLNFHAPQ